jgi:hypothetical protein
VGAATPTARTSLDALLGAEKLRIKRVSGHGRGAIFHHFDQAIILLIESVHNVGVELGIGEGLTDGCKRVSEPAHFVVVVLGAHVQFLALAEFTTERVGTRL